MICIVKPAAPTVLVTKGLTATRELCEAYESAPNDFKSGARTFDDNFDQSIYAAKEVKDTLRVAQHDKCAFCESLDSHTGYGDVEHYRPKAAYKQRETDELKRTGYYWLAYAWDNLLYACQLCNQRFKQNLFPLKDGRRRARSHTHNLGKEEPLLADPSRLDPADFIGFRGERAYAIGGCPEGESTIAILGLNRSELLAARGKRLQDLGNLVRLRDLLHEKVATAPAPQLVEEIRKYEEKLQARTRATSEYAAMARLP